MSVTVTPHLVDWAAAREAWQESAEEFFDALNAGDWADPEPDGWNDSGSTMVDALHRYEKLTAALSASERAPFDQILPLLFDSTDIHDLDEASDGDAVPPSLSPERCVAWSQALRGADWPSLHEAAAQFTFEGSDVEDPDDFLAYLTQWRSVIDAAAASQRGLVLAIG